jgi:hypothetical protein
MYNYFNNRILSHHGGGMESAEEITPIALDWLERNGEKDNCVFC